MCRYIPSPRGRNLTNKKVEKDGRCMDIFIKKSVFTIMQKSDGLR